MSNKVTKILHLLHWRLSAIIPIVPKIKEQGFNAIQISPMQGQKNDSNKWYELYQPTNLKIGNCQIGSYEDLQVLCAKCHEFGIKVIADVVLRHVASDEQDSLKPHKNVDPDLLKYLAEPINCDNYNDRWQCTHRCTNLPMLNYDDPDLQLKYIDLLNDYVSAGVDGFRLDQLKHYALPDEGSNIMSLFRYYNFYGEAINCDKWTLDRYAEWMGVLTEGRPTDTSKLIAKCESHDDYLTFKSTCRMDGDTRLREWDILINKNRFSSIFYARPFDNLWLSEGMKAINTINNVINETI